MSRSERRPISPNTLNVRFPPIADIGGSGFLAAAGRIIAYEQQGGGVSEEPRFISLFAPQLSAAIIDDRRNDGNVGKLDFDPLCQCQDSDGIEFRIIEANARGPSGTLQVELSSDAGSSVVTYQLRRSEEGWQIVDIAGVEVPSLVNPLKR